MNIKNLFSQHRIKPNKRLGQNFLTDKSTLTKIIQAADLSPNDIVLEVGPGLGVLTLELAQRAKKVIAVEKDKKMAAILENVLNDKGIKNVEIVKGDILKIDTPLRHPDTPAGEEGSHKHGLVLGYEILQSPPAGGSLRMTRKNGRSQNDNFSYKLIANIPYYLTSPLIRKFLESENPPKKMILMIQKEVAQRICSKPPKMTLLSIATQFYAKPKIISYVSKKSFWPQPKVDSAIIRIVPHLHIPVIASGAKQSPDIATRLPRDPRSFAITLEFRNNFFRLVKAAFSQPRKQLINNLSKSLKMPREKIEKILLKCGIKPTQRPSELSVDKYMEIAWILWGK